MTEPFALHTADPRFDPREPVTVNGYLYVPAEREIARCNPKPVLSRGRSKTVVEVKRRRLVVERA